MRQVRVVINDNCFDSTISQQPLVIEQTSQKYACTYINASFLPLSHLLVLKISMKVLLKAFHVFK